jgi:hypothetical protein
VPYPGALMSKSVSVYLTHKRWVGHPLNYEGVQPGSF